MKVTVIRHLPKPYRANAVMLSRLDRRVDNRTALDKLYSKLPEPRLLIGQNEKQDRRFWNYIASKRSK